MKKVFPPYEKKIIPSCLELKHEEKKLYLSSIQTNVLFTLPPAGSSWKGPIK